MTAMFPYWEPAQSWLEALIRIAIVVFAWQLVTHAPRIWRGKP